jgi:aminoglycoside phosphotransferase (APT) family kinase protein
MHDDEVATDASLVRGLIAAQFPQWARLDIDPVRSEGTDNAIYRLGGELAARLPRRPDAVAPLHKEHIWLPRLAPSLPLSLPVPLAKGAPGEGYPWPWSVCPWLDGENPASAGDSAQLARDLASFVFALQAIDAADAPRPGRHNFGRGAPLARLRPTLTERFAWLADVDGIGAVSAAWKADAQAPPWTGPPLWIHGDLSAGNLLTRAGRLSGVIDWSCLGAGDPACELQVAWTFLDRDARQTFRAALNVDDATWTRGRAWGLAVGVLNLSYYRTRSPRLAENGRRAIAAVLADHARASGPS